MFDRDAQDAATPYQERYYFNSGDRPLEGFTIKRAIGRGGFGEVYYAVSDSGKEVALKLLTRNVEIEKRGVQQCMNLKSPHLITVYDMRTTAEGDTFVVMEYVSGPSLAQILDRHEGGLPPHEVRMWLKGLVEGVAYLHDHGIVHRDLKPANLFLEEGVVKIGDYGLSKFIANSQEAGHSAAVGTCFYMAPEISTGKYQKPIDIYATGVILYEMITGTVPFEGQTPHEVLMKHLTSRPDVSPLPEPYREIVAKALAKDPMKRQQSAYELLPSHDVPKTPDIRFIGEGKSSPAGSADLGPDFEPVSEPQPQLQANTNAPPKDDVLRIEDEDSVLYIGPDTMPPRSSRAAWFGGSARPRRRNAARPASSKRRSAPAARSEDPAPLPPPRLRVAETATSMLMAAPLCLAIGLPAILVFGEASGGSELARQAAVVFGTSMLGVWSLLLPTKLWEGRQIDGPTRRFTLAAIGLAFGSLLVITLGWTFGLSPNAMRYTETEPGVVWANLTGIGDPRVRDLGPPLFFALAFALGPWGRLTERRRRRRFRLMPVLWTGLIGFVLCHLVPTPINCTVVPLMLMAVVLQLVSPREDRQAAARAAA